MKRVASLLLFVSIACAGCYEVEIDKLNGLSVSDKVTETAKQNKVPVKATQIRGSRGWIGEWDMITQLGFRIEALEMGLREVKAEPIQIEALLVRISELESALELQRAEIETLKNAFRLYEVVIEAQKTAINSLEKLCCIYEAEIERISSGSTRDLCEPRDPINPEYR